MSVKFKLIPIDNVPIRQRGKWAPILDAFLEQDNDSCLIEVSNDVDMERMACSIQAVILYRKIEDEVQCARIGNTVYLMKLKESK